MKRWFDAVALKMMIAYFILSSLWISLSDKILFDTSNNSEELTRFSTLKGLGYTIVVGLIFYVLVTIAMNKHRETEKKLQQAALEKDILLKEAHHRIKNNLIVIDSILNLEKELIVDPRDIPLFEETQARLRLISLVHEHFYKSKTLQNVDLTDYLSDLTGAAYELFAHETVKIKFDVESIMTNLDIATPVGLIMMEAMTNAFRHGLKKGSGEVIISLHYNEAGPYIDDKIPCELVLTIRDSGIGFPSEIQEGLGCKLIDALANQIHAKVTRTNQNGAVFKLIIPNILENHP